jgi:hypothetical protein
MLRGLSDSFEFPPRSSDDNFRGRIENFGLPHLLTLTVLLSSDSLTGTKL